MMNPPPPLRRFEGWFFDLYAQRDQMVLWFLTLEGESIRLLDPFSPSFFVAGFHDPPRRPHTASASPPFGPDRPASGASPAGRAPLPTRDRFLDAVEAIPGLESLGTTERLDFWTGRPREVEEVRVTDLDRTMPNLRSLARRFPDLVYFHCDIPTEIHYGYERGLFPTARCAVEASGERLVACTVLDRQTDTDYEPLPLRTAELRAEGQLTGSRPRLRSLTLAAEGRSITFDDGPPAALLASLRDCLADADPDLLWTHGGDSMLFPALFGLASQYKVALGLDRERGIEREVVHDGRSYISYGRVLYQAPDYPLYGRWHIDRNNSFWTGETGLNGLLEVARMSKIPVQRAARRSIGTGISSIQLDDAYRNGYLIPWKKSQPEAWKSAETLLKADRGGLVYQPVVGVYENVIELDFASMYPTIMVRCNVSPETVNCTCCTDRSEDEASGAATTTAGDVPELGYRICERRRGLVSRALEPIIDKRARYKQLMRERKTEAAHAHQAGDRAGEAWAQEHLDRYDGRQGALKWLLVCCFGYLGYRNARFGRIEAHESTCAFSREKLLRTHEICEAHGFDMIHAIVDCVWIRKPGATKREIDRLCEEINRATNLILAVEGWYRWIAFLPSKQNPDMPVPNRYFGCFEDGKLKYRGIEIRRSDQIPYVKTMQGKLLEKLTQATTLADCRAMEDDLAEIVHATQERLLQREALIDELVLRRKTSKEADEYRNNSMTAVAARQAVRAGVPLHAGEAIHFLVLNAKDRDPDSRLRLTSLLQPEETYDVDFYVEQVRRAAATILEPIIGKPLDAILGLESPAAKKQSSAPEQTEPFSQPDLFSGGIE